MPLLLGLLLMLAALSPALAQSRRTPIAVSSPCSHFMPTGEPLPRQDSAVSATVLYPTPTPARRSERIAELRRGEAVTVIQECGEQVRIRTVEGVEGWLNVMMLPNERRLADRAAKRPIATDRDCEARFIDAVLVQRCKDELAEKRTRQVELETSRVLPEDELRRFLSNKTVGLLPRPPGSREGHPAARGFFRPDGEYFLAGGDGGNATIFRGRWVVDGPTLCLPKANAPCAQLRRLNDRRTIWVTDQGVVHDLELTEGDGAGVVATVSKRYPDPVLPPTPSDLLPILGRNR